MTNEIAVKYNTLTGQDVTLTPTIIRKYLVNGDGEVSDQEIMMFLSLCKYQNLNPFLREAYLIKYGSEKATMVVGKETFLKRAVKNPKYRGHTTGISEDRQKAWAEVYVEGYQVPIKCEVDYEEYVGRKKDGTITKMWKTKGKTMLKKVALVQALREAFPEDFGGMYSPEEISHIRELPENNVEIPSDNKKPKTALPQEKPPELGRESIKEKLAAELKAYCGEASDDYNREILIEITSFTDQKTGEVRCIDKFNDPKFSDKWAYTALGNLRKKIASEKESDKIAKEVDNLQDLEENE